MTPQRRVTVVGSSNADLVTTVASRPAAGETVLGGDLEVHPGGKGANQAVAAALLGASVRFVGAVGRDAHGEMLVASLASAGVDVRGVQRLGDAPTGVALITVTPDGENAIVVCPGANMRLTPVMISVADADDILLLQMEIPAATVQALVAAAPPPTQVILNLAPPIPVNEATLRRVDILVVNEHEAAMLLGFDSAMPEQAVTALLGLGPRHVVVTCGAAGAFVSEAAGVAHVAAPVVAPVDTTGAGDAFVGALAWRLSVGDELEAACRVAVRVGAQATLSRGAQSSFPTEVVDV